MNNRHFLIFTLVILLFNFTYLAFSLSCQIDSDCFFGTVCSANTSPKQCVYGCHGDNDCAIDTTTTQNQKCDTTTRPFWSCTCGSDSACPAGKCVNGHCVLSCVFDSDCVDAYGAGYVCSTIQPTLETCIYACHNESDCASNVCDQKVTPHWLCTCGSTPCKGSGKCVTGHCKL
ncbi:unnamed protein product [Rhizophagus irregularis]|uniref:Uncharacterized protein n=1 Tax=Rhizophagus irregularis TaxID=588596 RepID=A0A2N1MSL6_9GLOM|nr:hypothetical protein RhiirC2_869199 [Rhizophagus irregularis]CAB4380848.1 unnamed protein product [Rhizophagus irregularis]CAB5366364.1 unnamed protein product [Rhizophagus irregularis]